VPCIRGWEGWVGGRSGEGGGIWGGLTMLLDTDDQAVCTVGQTDGHSSPYHTMNHAKIHCSKLPY